MRPVPDPKLASSAGATPAADATAPTGPGLPADRPLRPVGPAKMKALRDAIRSGRYPTDDAVRAGLERMIRRARTKPE